MRDIYYQAERVIICLGHEDLYDKSLRIINEIYQDVINDMIKDINFRRALEDLRSETESERPLKFLYEVVVESNKGQGMIRR